MAGKAELRRGIISYGAYIPYWRLDRQKAADALGSAASAHKKGFRRVAGFDEDTTTMGVAAGRLALKDFREADISDLWFSTAEPAYLEKTNATAIHSALRLDMNASALDLGGASRSGIGILKNALAAATGAEGKNQLLISAGVRTGMSGSSDEVLGGDAAAAFLIGASDAKNSQGIIAECIGSASATKEFLDRWRSPQENSAHQWEERFGEHAYEPLVENALKSALGEAGLNLENLDRIAVSGTHPRAVKKAAGNIQKTASQKTEGAPELADELTGQIGNAGAAHPGLLLCSMLETAEPNQTLALIWLADGAEVLIFRTTEAIQAFKPALPLAAQLDQGAEVSYMIFLRWRGFLKVQPPNRPEPPRISAPAGLRSEDWKYGFVGSRGDKTKTLHMPPARISIKEGDTPDAMISAPMADMEATVSTYTIDRLAYSESPPVIFAIVDFEGGGRFAVELTDVDESELSIGMKVEMAFRKLYTTAEGIHNYFYKARPVRNKMQAATE